MDSPSGELLPVIIGLVLGVVFIFVFYTLASNRQPPSVSIPQRFTQKVPIEDEFKSIEQIPEVSLFLEKYEDHMTIYFGRSQNHTIQFTYSTWAQVDKDGDGYKEVFRRLELTLFYDESGGKPIDKSYDPDRLKQMVIRCREQTALSLDIDKAFTDIMQPAYDGQVKDILENEKCFF